MKLEAAAGLPGPDEAARASCAGAPAYEGATMSSFLTPF
jgi:hypothetical protein